MSDLMIRVVLSFLVTAVVFTGLPLVIAVVLWSPIGALVAVAFIAAWVIVFQSIHVRARAR